MKYTEIKQKDSKELQTVLKDERIGLGKLRFELNNKSLPDSSKIRTTRRNIAKILTAIKAETRDRKRVTNK